MIQNIMDINKVARHRTMIGEDLHTINEAGYSIRLLTDQSGKFHIEWRDAGFQQLCGPLDPGKRVELTVWRDGAKEQLRVKLGERPDAERMAEKEQGEESKLGVRVQALTESMAGQLGYEDEEGVVVSWVDPNGPAAEKGIRRGDLIQRIGRRKIASLKEYSKVVKELKPGEAVMLLVKRQDRVFFVAIKIPEK